MDEILEVTFFTEGEYRIGYMINKEEKIVIRCIPKVKGEMIGSYGATFGERAREIYKTSSDCKGHFIRK